MADDIVRNAASIVADTTLLEEFSGLNRIGIDAAKALLERLMKEPEMSDVAKDFIESKDRSLDFQGYVAGEDKGHVRGHEEGFSKGAAIGVIGGLTIAGLAFLVLKR